MRKFLKFMLTIALIFTLVFSGAIDSFGSSVNGAAVNGANEVKVQLNGENIVFTGAAGKNVNGSILVPVRQMLEVLGASVTYDSAAKTVSAKSEDMEIIFAVGATEVTIVENGTKSIKTMNTVPFIDGATQSIYVPVRFFAESLGYCVGWDADEKTVVVFDPAELFGNADEDFSILAKLIKTDLDYEQAYETTGKFDAEIAAYATTESAVSFDLSLEGEISGIQQKSNADLAMRLTVNADKMTDSIPSEDAAGMALILDMLKNITLNIKTDGETGTTYIHSGVFSAMDPEIAENTWFKMNVFKPYEEAGIDMKSFSRMGYSDIDLSELLITAVSSLDDMDTSTYENIKAGYVFLKNLAGDEAFRTETTGSIKTHTLKIDRKAILSAMVGTALSEGIPDIASASEDAGGLEDLEDLASFEVNLTIKEKGGLLYNYDINGSFAAEGIDGSFEAAGDQKNADTQMTLDIRDVMKMDINVESHMKETSKAPDLNPPSDAVIVEYTPEATEYTLDTPEVLNAV